MKFAVSISRILLGLIFIVFGLNGFLHFISVAQYPGVTGQFLKAIFTSHFYILVFCTEIVGGSLLLVNRYVPMGLLLLGPVLVNILNFHISMYPTTIPLALRAPARWLVLFVRMRRAFSGVFVRRFQDTSAPMDHSLVSAMTARG
jgi:putative oxidoreductase